MFTRSSLLVLAGVRGLALVLVLAELSGSLRRPQCGSHRQRKVGTVRRRAARNFQKALDGITEEGRLSRFYICDETLSVCSVSDVKVDGLQKSQPLICQQPKACWWWSCLAPLVRAGMPVGSCLHCSSSSSSSSSSPWKLPESFTGARDMTKLQRQPWKSCQSLNSSYRNFSRIIQDSTNARKLHSLFISVHFENGSSIENRKCTIQPWKLGTYQIVNPSTSNLYDK